MLVQGGALAAHVFVVTMPNGMRPTTEPDEGPAARPRFSGLSVPAFSESFSGTTPGPESDVAPHSDVDQTNDPNKPFWIVLVEDNPADVRLVREAFYECELRYNLTVLSDGEKALGLIERLEREHITCPDLLLLDINLPRKGGFQVLERTRSSAQCARIPVVILTSSNAQKDRDTAARLGVTRYIQKPGRLEDYLKLGAVFREILDGWKAE